MERRFLEQQRATVRTDTESNEITGLASVYYDGTERTEYKFKLSSGETVHERILPGAFDKAIAEGQDVRALFNHNPDHLLGRTQSGTLQLRSEKEGLRYTVKIDNEDPDHKRLLPKFKRGDLTGSSFAFGNVQDDIRQEKREGQEVLVREIESVDLFDVGPVTYPAYEASQSGIRSDNTQELEQRVKKLKEKQRIFDYVEKLK